MMFREIFDKYINNKANDEEIEIVENEIEKVEIINEYLADNEDDKFIKDSIKEDRGDYTDLSNNKEDVLLSDIKSAINKKLMKVGVLSGVIVILLLLGLKLVVSPIMNSVYYNPQEKIDEFSTKMDLDLDIYTELHFPGYYNLFNNYESLGFGKYEIGISQQSYFKNDESKMYNVTLDKNEFEVDASFYKYEAMNSFSRGIFPFDSYPKDVEANQIEELKKLPDYTQVKANISFNKDLNMEEIKKLMNNNDNMNYYWIGIRGCDLETQRFPYVGIAPSGTGVIFEKNSIDSKKYPYLDLGGVKNIDAKTLEIHFKSMLKYMSDNNNFSKVKMINKKNDLFYKEALDYVNENGVLSYGMVVSGTPKDILELRENPLVECINVKDVKLSSLEN